MAPRTRRAGVFRKSHSSIFIYLCTRHIAHIFDDSRNKVAFCRSSVVVGVEHPLYKQWREQNIRAKTEWQTGVDVVQRRLPLFSFGTAVAVRIYQKKTNTKRNTVFRRSLDRMHVRAWMIRTLANFLSGDEINLFRSSEITVIFGIEMALYKWHCGDKKNSL